MTMGKEEIDLATLDGVVPYQNGVAETHLGCGAPVTEMLSCYVAVAHKKGENASAVVTEAAFLPRLTISSSAASAASPLQRVVRPSSATQHGRPLEPCDGVGCCDVVAPQRGGRGYSGSMGEFAHARV